MSEPKKVSQLFQLWTYIRPYKLHFFAAIFLTVVMSILNVAEPYILGLAITEIGNNVADMLRNETNAGINYPFIYRIMLIYFLRALVYQATIITVLHEVVLLYSFLLHPTIMSDCSVSTGQEKAIPI